MPKKAFSRETVIEAFGGSRRSTPFFASLSDDAWLGWIAATIHRDNLSSGLSPKEMFALVKQLYEEGALA